MEIKILVISIIILAFTIMLCLIRAIKGPSPADRLIAINVIGTKTIVLISIVSFILKETYFIDVVLVYALISFVASIVISNIMLNTGGEKE
ncbi:monovalent cation/H+ antiporter complex subunit F [Brassicibacter mesophilus]|uniref:monovalent cation/H+ antiporter complex subunit F n=1 Tax=Brassicibacter mesophilus TaxID=745119 RepID=UPI003D1AE5EE